MPRHDRVVLDTNIIVSLILNGAIEFIAEVKYEYGVQVYTCPEQITELTNTLNYPKFKKRFSGFLRHYINYFRKYSEQVSISTRFDRVPDSDDNYLFDLAYTVKAYYIISGDRKVRALKQVNEIRTISLTEFRKILKRKEDRF